MLIYPANVIARLKSAGGVLPIWLLELQTADGTNYFLSDVADPVGFTSIITGATQAYLPWIKSVGPLRTSKDTRADAADLTLQNLSGNTIQRDMWAAMATREFEGALAVLRLYDQVEQYALRTFQWSLTEPDSDHEQVTFRLIQLLDPNNFVAPWDSYSEQCTWRYQSAQCGSTANLGTYPTCPKTLSACTARGAVERFNGCPYSPPATTFVGTPGGV